MKDRPSGRSFCFPGHDRRATHVCGVKPVKVTDRYITGLGVADLRPDVIDDAAVTAFTEGWCWALALALHGRTGMDIWVVTASNGGWHHSGVLEPSSGAVIDIEGRWAIGDWVAYWGEITEDDTGARPLTDSEQLRFGQVLCAEEQQAVDVAHMFVPTVLAAVTDPHLAG